jgi:hypothetical protein
MARVILTIEDSQEGVEISADFQPELPEELSEEELEGLSDAQLFALEILQYVADQEEAGEA